MLRIDNLIKHEKVNWIKLSDLLDYEQPTKYIVKSTEYNDSFDTPVLTAGQTFVLGYTDETTGIYPASKDNPVIIFDDFTTGNHWVDFEFKVKSSAMKILKPKNQNVNLRYCYHYIQTIKFDVTEHKRVWISKFSQIEIPIPSMETQQEIVNILDKFTKCVTELQAELQAREKQNKFYMNSLLTFKDPDIPIVELGTVISKKCSGATPIKGNPEYYQEGTIPWIRTKDVRFNDIVQVESYITQRALDETAVKVIPQNCLIVAISGATAGRCAVNKIEGATTNQHCLNLEIDNNKALYRYVFYCIWNKYDDLISKKRGARGDLNSSLILSLKIPIPSLEVQEKIVNILDEFNLLISDFKVGLPAEIEAREKQYVYYRDKLLRFSEKT